MSSDANPSRRQEVIVQCVLGGALLVFLALLFVVPALLDGKAAAIRLQVGDCVAYPSGDYDTSIEMASCVELHGAEVFARLDAVGPAARNTCQEQWDETFADSTPVPHGAEVKALGGVDTFGGGGTPIVTVCVIAHRDELATQVLPTGSG